MPERKPASLPPALATCAALLPDLDRVLGRQSEHVYESAPLREAKHRVKGRDDPKHKGRRR